MVISPDLETLQYKTIRGVKYFELFAEEIKQEILPGLYMKALGYNGTTPGPTIIVNPGDHVNIRVYNKLSEPTSVHWHGVDVPNEMDGVPDIEPSSMIYPESYFDYQFHVKNPPGTHMYYSYFSPDKQIMKGLMGGFIIQKPNDLIDRDYFLMLQEFKLVGLELKKVTKGEYDIDVSSKEFNFHLINGKAYPFLTSMEVNAGEQVRIRLANSMVSCHSMHLHGHQFCITATDGNERSTTMVIRKNTLNVAPGETWDIELNGNNPGIWPFHSSIPYQVTNNNNGVLGGMMTNLEYK